MIKLLKTLQQSTRYMQHCCGHSKVAKDTNLVNNVPQLKKSLETLLFRVKVVNNILSILFRGQLGKIFSLFSGIDG